MYSTLRQQTGVIVRTFAFKEEHKVWSLFLKTYENMRTLSVIFSPKTRVKPQRSQTDQDRMDVGQGSIRQCSQKGDLNPVKKGIPSCNQEEAQAWP